MFKNKNFIIAVIVPVLVLVVIFYVYEVNIAKDSMEVSSGYDNQMQGTVPTPVSEAGVAEEQTQSVKEFVVSGKNFLFDPAVLTVAKGDRVKITFKNAEGFHDFKIDEFAAITPRIQENQDAIVEFTAEKVGTFEYYCSVGKHRAMGMKGTLVVE